jgi:hypothetical protein
MRRRDFLAAAGTYSVYVNAAALPPAPQQPSFPQAEWKRDFDILSPPETLRRMSPVEPHMTLVDLSADVLVAGGGLAGVCAAVAAARHGAKVILVQDRSRLGGNSSSEVKMHVVGANHHKSRPGWREGGLLEEFRLDDAVNNPQRCWEMWDLLLYDKVISEPNITLLLDSTLYSAQTKDGRIEEVMVRCDKSEHLYRIRARIFLDCTGDSRLGLESGADYRTGREARSEFGESLAPETADQETLGSSILFTARIYPRPMPFTPPIWARKVTREHLKLRRIRSWEYGYWWIEWGGNRDTIRDNERIRFELLSIVMGVWDYIKNSGEFASVSNWALDWIGMMPGKRGSRRLVGDHILTQHDLMKGSFEDAVAIGGWPMDDHPPGGFDRADLPPAVQIKTPEVYNIPLRSLYSRNISNLMMAGRNISASHVAFTSTRVMATCAVCGQAAGTAAAICVRDGITPRELANKRERVFELQQTLLRDDQTIRDLKNLDPTDVARKAKVSASGANGLAKPELVLDGIPRDIPGKEIHHWEGPLGPEGAWLELAWERPQRIGEVQITFDTGFHRELTLTASDTINTGILRQPQPETVKDYDVLYRGAAGEPWKPLVQVRGNYQRLRRHKFSPVEASAVRIHARATHGAAEARIFEVRCYA